MNVLLQFLMTKPQIIFHILLNVSFRCKGDWYFYSMDVIKRNLKNGTTETSSPVWNWIFRIRNGLIGKCEKI